MTELDDALEILNDPSCNHAVSAFQGYEFTAADFPEDRWTIHVGDGCLVLFFHASPSTRNVHIAFLPERRGATARDFIETAIAETFADPAIDAIVALFPSRITAVRRLADGFGFVPMGSSPTQEHEPWERSVLTRVRYERWVTPWRFRRDG